MTSHTIQRGLLAWVIAAGILSGCTRGEAPSATAPDATASSQVPPVDAVVETAPRTLEQVVTLADPASEAAHLLPGFFRASMTLDDLRVRFGAANVKVTKIAGAEGAAVQVVVLFPDDATRRAELFLRDEPEPRGLALMRVSGKNSRWHLDNGVRLGMTLGAVVALNGKPVTFSGLDWDYGGTVSHWHEGRLAPRAGDRVFRSVTLTHNADPQEGAFPLGDGEYRSDDPSYPGLSEVLHVGALQVTF